MLSSCVCVLVLFCFHLAEFGENLRIFTEFYGILRIFTQLSGTHQPAQELEIRALFAEPITYWEDVGLHEVVDYLRHSSHLSLPAAWPADF